MATGWFLAPYKRRAGPEPVRYCSVDDFTPQVIADGGTWSESECLGNSAVVKVKASVVTLALISASPGVFTFPGANLTDPLAALTAPQVLAIMAAIEALGYTAAEINSRLPHVMNTYELGDLLRFICQRRLQPRYDVVNDVIVLDGPVQPTVPVEIVDSRVQ